MRCGFLASPPSHFRCSPVLGPRVTRDRAELSRPAIQSCGSCHSSRFRWEDLVESAIQDYQIAHAWTRATNLTALAHLTLACDESEFSDEGFRSDIVEPR